MIVVYISIINLIEYFSLIYLTKALSKAFIYIIVIQNNPYLSLITKPIIAKKMLQYNQEYYEERSLYPLIENILIYRDLHWLGREMKKYSYSIKERDNAVFEIFKNAKYKDYATASVLNKQKIVHSLMNKIMMGKTP